MFFVHDTLKHYMSLFWIAYLYCTCSGELVFPDKHIHAYASNYFASTWSTTSSLLIIAAIADSVAEVMVARCMCKCVT